MQTVAEKLARKIEAYHNCWKSGKEEWKEKHRQAIREIEKEYLPRGSGIDFGTEFALSGSDKTVFFFHVPFRYMNSRGYYVGILNFTLQVVATFTGPEVKKIYADDSREIDPQTLSEFDLDNLKEDIAVRILDSLNTEIE